MNLFNPSALDFSTYFMEKYGTIENLQRKAKSGEMTAQVDLGMAYSEGLGKELPKDIDKAIGWLYTTVQRGCEFPLTFETLGKLLDRKGTIQDRRRAYEMYLRAARIGCTSSQINLAEMYRCGVEGVVNKDLSEAFEWYKKAAGEDPSNSCSSDWVEYGKLFAGTMKRVEAVMGDEQKKSALLFLYKHYLQGDCPEGRPQPTKAIYYLTRTAELGDTEAQLKLGQVYLHGSCEQVKDVARAKRWLEKAASKGEAKAKELLRQCEQLNVMQNAASDITEEAFTQSFGIMAEKLKGRSEIHPLAILQPVIFSEEMLSEFDWSPTARIFLKAFKLVKEGWEILHNSNFTDERGISLIAYGFLSESSVLQAFPLDHCVTTKAFHLCEITLKKNSRFFEGLVISYAFQGCERKRSIASHKVDYKRIMCLKNIINFIQNDNADSPPSKDPFKFDESYGSWLHILYYSLGGLYMIADQFEDAAEAFENSLKCCPSYFEAKRGLGCSLLESTVPSKIRTNSEGESTQVVLDESRAELRRNVSKYSLWTKEQLLDGAEKTLKEFLAEAPPCWKTYPDACYSLAQLALLTKNMVAFKKSYELGQDAEEKRLPFFNPVDLPLKHFMTHYYQLFANVKLPVMCGNRMCTKNLKENELLTCSSCRKQKYCGKECQTADWKNHKAACHALGKSKRKETAERI